LTGIQGSHAFVRDVDEYSKIEDPTMFTLAKDATIKNECFSSANILYLKIYFVSFWFEYCRF
jgi:hypothetical protein